MKSNKLTLCLALVGAVSLVPFAHADVIVDNILGDTVNGSDGTSYSFAQAFNTGTGSGMISSIGVDMAVGIASALDLYIYSDTGSGPSALVGTVGTISSPVNGLNMITLGSSIQLNAGTVYDLVMRRAGGNLGWNYTSGSVNSTTGGSLGHPYDGNYALTSFTTAGQSPTPFMLSVSVTPVPEPITQALMVFGSVILLVSAGRWCILRFKADSPASA